MKIGNMFEVSPGKKLNAYPPGCFLHSACDECPQRGVGDTMLVTKTCGPTERLNKGLTLVLYDGELKSMFANTLKIVGATE